MNHPDLFDPAPTGAALRDAGIATATRHADAVRADWNAQALAIFTEYARMNARFTTEDARNYASGRGFPAPPDHRAWGGILRMALAAGVVTQGGYVKAKNPDAHCRPVMLWHSRIIGVRAE